MPTLTQRLRELDRRVLREHRFETAEGWTTAMGRWRWGVAGSLVNLGLVIVFLTRSSNWMLTVVLLSSGLFGAFQAGAMKTEHDRITGTGKVLGKRRPPGL